MQLAEGMRALSVLCVGPNPALQRVLTFNSELSLGGVNRASALSQYVGGKGQGVGLAIHRWAPGAATVAHFVGGDTGSAVEAMLEAAGVARVSQTTAAQTRICTTLLSRGVAGGTELIDKSGTVSEEEVTGLLDAIAAQLDRFNAVALCGTCPPGAASLYGKVVDRLAADPGRDQCLLLVDGFKQLEEVLGSGRLDVLKLNLLELKTLTGAETAEAAAAILFAEDGALRRRGALLAITDGPHPALLFASATKAWRLHVPEIDVVNAIGAGDVCTSVFLYQLARARAESEGGADDAAAPDAFAWGLAAACARCCHEQPTWARSEVDSFREAIRIEVV